MEQLNLDWSDVQGAAAVIAGEIYRIETADDFHSRPLLYGVPRGGIFAAQAVLSEYLRMYPNRPKPLLVEDPKQSDYIIDDIIDSGATRDSYVTKLERPFYALVIKASYATKPWVSFPWERMCNDSGIEDNIVRILQNIGEDPEREGLKDTPKRVAKAYKELFAGYNFKEESVLRFFEDGTCDEMVLCKDIEFYSMCEHHMLPFFGKAHIAYIPGKKLIGLSKLPRILEGFARRLQVQERLTSQITECIDRVVDPKGSACIIEAKHFCCMARGIGKQGSSMTTSSLTGVFRKPEVRQELLSLINR